MLRLENKKLEWGLSALFGIVSIAIMMAAFFYFNNQGSKVVQERTDRDVSDNGPVKSRRKQDAVVELDDVEKVHSDIANLRASLKDQKGDLPDSELGPSSPDSLELAVFSKSPRKPLAPGGGSIPSSASPEPDELVGDDDLFPSPSLRPSEMPDDLLPSVDVPPDEALTEETLLSYTGDTISERDEAVTLRAELSEPDAPGGDLSGNEIVFTLSDGIRTQLATAITDPKGRAQVLTPISLPAGFYNIKAQFAGDNHYLGSSTEVPFVVWEAIAGLSINGRGRLTEESEKASFSFSVEYTKKSDAPLGKVQLVDKSGKSDLDIYAEGFNWLIVTADNLALLQGSASLNGKSGFLFELLIADNGTPGKGKDFFELSIYGVPVASGLIDSGNIVVN